MKHIFIVNPYTCKKKTSSIIKIIEDYCMKKNYDFTIIKTSSPKHATDIASQYTEKDTCIYAVGGDGTAFEIVNGLQEHVSMGIIPAGTGNDYFKMIHTDYDNLNDLIIDTIEGKTVFVDFGQSNLSRFLNCLTLGIDARVNDMVCKMLKKTPIPKFMLYGIAAIINVFNPKPFHVIISIDNIIIEKEVVLLAIMNGKFYGNGFTPLLGADIQDGQFDLCIVDKTPIIKMLRLLPKYFKGNITNIKEITKLQGTKISIKTNQLVNVQLDGENFYTDDLNILVHHKKLKLRVPTYSKLT